MGHAAHQQQVTRENQHWHFVEYRFDIIHIHGFTGYFKDQSEFLEPRMTQQQKYLNGVKRLLFFDEGFILFYEYFCMGFEQRFGHLLKNDFLGDRCFRSGHFDKVNSFGDNVQIKLFQSFV
jgi:hypothetical protein